MHIGLIGGIGPAATDYYYRRLISAFSSKQLALDLTMVHADSVTLLGNLEHDNVDAQVAIYSRLTDRLVKAGANCVVVTSIAGHFCIESFKEVSPLPVVDMIIETDEAIKSMGLRRVGILGTRTVMETRFYGGVSSAEIVPPGGSDLDDVHNAYVTMAASGQVSPDQRTVFETASRRLLEEANVDAIMLGGTDLALVYGDGEADFQLVDCAAIHVDAVVRLAIS